MASSSASQESFGERWILSNLRRLVILIIIVAGETVGLRFLRLVNRRFRIIQQLFVMYPANEHYAKKIVFPFWLGKYRRRLAPCMVFRHGGAFGLVLGTTIPERDLRRDPELVARLKRLADEASSSLGVDSVTYSGILPTLLLRSGLIEKLSEAETTAKVVAAGVEHVREQHALNAEVPVVVLGGAGEIGKRVVRELETAGRSVHVLDPVLGKTALENDWRHGPLLLVNVAHRGALHAHLEQLWEGVVYVNEAYPEPRQSELKELAQRDVPVWHVAGVKARAFPPFPGAYGGGIPCCAASGVREAVPVMRRLG